MLWNPRHAEAHLADADPRFADIIARIGPCTLEMPARADPFPALLRSIVYQQLSGKAAATIHGRLMTLFPRKTPRPDRLLELADEDMRRAGMSRGKVAAARDLAAKVLDGTVPKAKVLATLADDEVKTRLTQVRGIGPWTAEMYLMFWLGRPDVLPLGDLGIQKGYMIGWNKRRLPSPQVLEKAGRKWAPYRTAASWYLWKLVDGDGATW